MAALGALYTEHRATVSTMVENRDSKNEVTPELYCPKCAQEVNNPLTCGDCGAVICPRCGTPLEAADELGMG